MVKWTEECGKSHRSKGKCRVRCPFVLGPWSHDDDLTQFFVCLIINADKIAHSAYLSDLWCQSADKYWLQRSLLKYYILWTGQ